MLTRHTASFDLPPSLIEAIRPAMERPKLDELALHRLFRGDAAGVTWMGDSLKR